MSHQPLKSFRVLDLSNVLAGPFCAYQLVLMGAEVIKVESPDGGDLARRLGADPEAAAKLMGISFLAVNAGKQSITLNLKHTEGKAILKKMVADADVLVENFRPGVMEKWGLGWEQVHALNPKAVMVRVSAYGQTGPYSARPGFARVAHAFSGLAFLAGEPGRVPVVPGSTSLADYMAGAYGALGAMVALQARARTGEGQCVDLALYEPVFRVLDEIAPAFQRLGVIRERMGADTVNVCPHSHYKTHDGKWIAIACSNDKIFARLAQAMGRPELASPERYGPTQKRLAARNEVNGIVADWVASLDCEDVLARCEAAGAPASLLYSIADIFADPQYAARENIRTVDSRVGLVAVPGVVPKLSGTPGGINWLGERLGGHNEAVLCGLLGLTTGELAGLKAQDVI